MYSRTLVLSTGGVNDGGGGGTGGGDTSGGDVEGLSDKRACCSDDRIV